MKSIRELIKGLIELIKGLVVTLRHLFKRAITLQYPKQRDVMRDRFRGRLEFDKDICFGCGLCELQCPVGAIRLDTTTLGAYRNIDYFGVDISRCIFCFYCRDVCLAGAIKTSDKYELAEYKREDLYIKF